MKLKKYVKGIKKHLNPRSLVKSISNYTKTIKEFRLRTKSIKYSIKDCINSAIVMFYLQNASLNQFQNELKKSNKFKKNLQIEFSVNSTPKDTQKRHIIDNIDFEDTVKIFPLLVKILQQSKYLEKFKFFDGYFLLSIDATQYFASNKNNCNQCLNQKNSDGTIHYFHKLLCATIVHPHIKEVIPLLIEPIQNSDGKTKQDCEINAAKRLIPKLRELYPKLKIIVLADALYSNSPFIQLLKDNRMHFMIGVKPNSHKVLFNEVELAKASKSTNKYFFEDNKNTSHSYEWLCNVPLNKAKNTHKINYFEYKEEKKNKNFKGSWVTDLNINEENIVKSTIASRSRWKIENNQFNNLKNQGYNFEHNYGHGKKNLSVNFAILMIVAFTIEQILKFTCKFYQKIRAFFTSTKEFFNNMRAFLKEHIFNSYADLIKHFFLVHDAKPP